jgi:hypothetical protein
LNYNRLVVIRTVLQTNIDEFLFLEVFLVNMQFNQLRYKKKLKVIRFFQSILNFESESALTTSKSNGNTMLIGKTIAKKNSTERKCVLRLLSFPDIKSNNSVYRN